MLYEFKLDYNAMEVIKKPCEKGEGVIDHSTVTRSLKKFHLGYNKISTMNDLFLRWKN